MSIFNGRVIRNYGDEIGLAAMAGAGRFGGNLLFFIHGVRWRRAKAPFPYSVMRMFAR